MDLVTVYSGEIARLNCTAVSPNSLICDSWSIAQISDNDFIASLVSSSVTTPPCDECPTTTQPTAAPPVPPRGKFGRTLSSTSFLQGNWEQTFMPTVHRRDIAGASTVLIGNSVAGNGLRIATGDGDVSFVAWLGFNSDLPSPFGFNVQFSVYNHSANSWTIPKSVDSSIVAARDPVVSPVAGTTDHFFVAWAYQNLAPGQTYTYEESLNKTEISVGLYMMETDMWSIVQLTTDSVYDGKPTICTTNFNDVPLVAVAWQRGTPFGTQEVVVSLGSISSNLTATDTWTIPEVLISGVTGLSALSCAWISQTVSVTYITLTGAKATLFVAGNNTIDGSLTIPADSNKDKAPIQTIVRDSSYVSSWIHGNNVLVQAILVDGSAGFSTSFTPTGTPSNVHMSSSSGYISITYSYMTTAGTTVFELRTIASGSNAFSNPVVLLTLPTNEQLVTATSQMIVDPSSGNFQIILLFTSNALIETIVNGVTNKSVESTNHKYAIMDLVPNIKMQSIDISASAGTLGLHIFLENAGLWESTIGEYSAFFYLGDVNRPITQLSSEDLPPMAVRAPYEIFPIVSISDISGGYLWVILAASDATTFENANKYSFALFTPSVSALQANLDPSGNIVISGTLFIKSAYTCSNVTVPTILETMDPLSNAYSLIGNTTITVPCTTPGMVSYTVTKSQVLGQLRLTVGSPLSGIATFSYDTSAQTTLSISPYPDLVVGMVSVTSPFLSTAALSVPIQNSALFSSDAFSVAVYYNNASVIYYQNNPSSGITIMNNGPQVAALNIEGLAGGASTTLNIPLDTITVPNAYTLHIVVNPSKNIAERNYANNEAQQQLTLVRNAYVTIGASAIRVEDSFLEFVVSNYGTETLTSGTVLVSISGATSYALGNVTFGNLPSLQCTSVKVSSPRGLTFDLTASVQITIPAILSGSFSQVIVTSPVSSAMGVVLPSCDSPINTQPSLIMQSATQTAVVGVPYTFTVVAHGISPFMLNLVKLNNTNLPDSAAISDPCVNSTVVCVKEMVHFTADISDIPTNSLYLTHEVTYTLTSTVDSSALATLRSTITLTSCGNGIKDHPMEECDGETNCQSDCTISATTGVQSTGGDTQTTASGTITSAPGTITSSSGTIMESVKDDDNRDVRLGAGIGVGLGVPLMVIGAAAVMLYLKKRVWVKNDIRGDIKMQNL